MVEIGGNDWGKLAAREAEGRDERGGCGRAGSPPAKINVRTGGWAGPGGCGGGGSTPRQKSMLQLLLLLLLLLSLLLLQQQGARPFFNDTNDTVFFNLNN